MSQLLRIYQICAMLNGGQTPSREDLEQRLGVASATIKRDIAYLRDQLNAPIIYDAYSRGYRFNTKPQVGPKFQLPGLWFSEEEVAALATFHTLLSNLDGSGLLKKHIDPLMVTVETILGNGSVNSKELRKRIKVLDTRQRRSNNLEFPTLGFALLNRKKIHIGYKSRSKQETTERIVSPQRLVNYQSNWYLDGWCHRTNNLRVFSVDRILSLSILNEAAKEVPDKELNDVLASGYGIFSGRRTRIAILKFTKEHAPWVVDERWHGQQETQILEDGSVVLKIPYSNDKELLMDIQRHGSHVEILSPPELRESMKAELRKLISIYEKNHEHDT